MTSDPDSSVSPDNGTIDKHDLLRIGLVWAVLLMNFVLALVNAHGIGMNANIVLAAQLLLTSIAGAIIIYNPPTLHPAFIVSMAIILLGYLIAGIFHQGLDARGLYDVLIIPIFIIIGITMNRIRPWMLNVPMAVIAIVAIIDGVLRDQFASFVNPLSYYRSTRAWVAEQNAAFSSDNGLYLGADRPGGSVFSFISDHRVGSIFLEPISLGYFAVIATIGYSVIYQKNHIKFYLSSSICLFLTLLADTRTAAFLVVICVLLATLTKKLPKVVTYLTPIAVLIFGAVVYIKTGGGGGELTFRLGLTYKALLHADSVTFFLGDVSSAQIYDSGMIATIYNLGAISTLVTIYLVSGIYIFNWKKYSHAPFLAILYLMVALLFGGAVFSIKTAALFGTIVGMAGRYSDKLSAEDTVRRPTLI